MADRPDQYWDHLEARWVTFRTVEADVPEQPTAADVEREDVVDVRSG